MPLFLADFAKGKAGHFYETGGLKAIMADGPMPRFKLLRFDNYLHVGIQWNRGCPFMFKFCDIIELFGRIPRGKSVDKVLEVAYITGCCDFTDSFV